MLEMKNDIWWREMFAKRLMTMMKSRGLTTKELSERSGISGKSIREYFKLKRIPSGYSIYMLAVGLDCSMCELVSFM